MSRYYGSSNRNNSNNKAVYLNVYDLIEQNEYLYPFGFGAYHSGVEIESVEYTYAGGSGVYTMAPKTAPQARFRESILMGHYTGTLLQFDAILHELRSKFGPDDYDLLTKNCNCFSESFVSLLLNKPIPGYVNRAASVGGLFRCCFDMNQPPVEQVNNGNDRTRGGSYGTNNPIYNSRSPGMPTSGGYRLGGGDASNSAVPGSTGGRGIGNKGIAARLSANNQSASDSDEKSNPSRNKATNMQPMAII